MAKRLWIQLFKADEGSSLTLPINPESITITVDKDVKTHNILGHGEVAVRGLKKLLNITLTSFLPDKDTYLALLASFVDKTLMKPYTTVSSAQMIDGWVKDGAIVRLIIADGLNEGINKEFLIKSFTKTLRENTADLGYSLELIEYDVPTDDRKAYTTNTKKIENAITGKIVKLLPRNNNNQLRPATTVVKAGQTIYKIARLAYGGRSNELAKLNKIYDQNKDLTGQVIEMLPR